MTRYSHPEMKDTINPVLGERLADFRRTVLDENPIWQGNFITSVQTEADDMKRWQLLETWGSNMPPASDAFRSYVLLVMARIKSPDAQFILGKNWMEESGYEEDEQDPTTGKWHYPKMMHTAMIDRVVTRIGLPDQGHDHTNPQFLPSTKHHVSTHLDLCTNGDPLEALGAVYLVECLTGNEFSIIGKGFKDTWPKVREQIITKRPNAQASATYFDEGENGSFYFAANTEADNGKKNDAGELTKRGHDQLMALAIQAKLLHMGIDINDPKQLEEPLAAIKRGMEVSIACRTIFMQGIYDHVYQKEKENKDKAISVGSSENYSFHITEDAEKFIAKGKDMIAVFGLEGLVGKEAGDGGLKVSPLVNIKTDENSEKLDLHQPESLEKIKGILTEMQRTADLDYSYKTAFSNMLRELPKQRSAS